MLTEQDVDKLLDAVYYDGECIAKYDEQNDDGSFNLYNEYLGFTSYDDTYGYLYILTFKTEIQIYEAVTDNPPKDVLVELLKATFPDKEIKVCCEEDDSGLIPPIHCIRIDF